MRKLLLLPAFLSLLLVFSCSKDDPEPDNSDLETYHMVYVEGGTFIMGCTSEQGDDCKDQEKPAHIVTVGDFYISKYEVTQKQWEDLMGDTPSYNGGCEDCPVERVSWDTIQTFLDKLNELTGKHYRLPTEAEWEFAARGGNQTLYTKYSGSDNVDLVAWYNDNSGGETHPVGMRKANELGLYDMNGNVNEWCLDWYGPFSPEPQVDPQGAEPGDYRTTRGGAFGSMAVASRVSYRNSAQPFGKNYSIGFRLARDP